MKGLLVMAVVLVPGAAGACEISVPEVNQQMSVGADCSFELAGPLDTWRGDQAQDLGGGVIVQEHDNNACGPDEELLVVDCSTATASVVFGLPTEDGWGRRLDGLLHPNGPVTIYRGMTAEELLRQVQRHGAPVDDWQSTIRAVETIPGDMPDPYCGCRLFYPGSAGAGS
jgi:hypothetical protein